MFADRLLVRWLYAVVPSRRINQYNGGQAVELGGMTKNLYHGIFLNYTGFTVYDGIFFPHG